MLDWLTSSGIEALAALSTAAGLGLTAIGSFIIGARKGRPTSSAVAAAVQAASCRVPDLLPSLEALREGQEELHGRVEDLQRDMAILKDRTAR
ncbi:hypothetical protein [Pseudoroseicyclus sp. CXY001]|uniref:hypothetical protein n=1 Tax=Pseudoroseicyclus sp. CXY001 TaxID=3242492 RepID=UPI003571721C